MRCGRSSANGICQSQSRLNDAQVQPRADPGALRPISQYQAGTSEPSGDEAIPAGVGGVVITRSQVVGGEAHLPDC